MVIIESMDIHIDCPLLLRCV